MPMQRAIILGSWVLFMLVWLVMGFGNKRTVHQQTRREMRGYMWPLLTGMVMMAIPPYRFPALSALVFPLIDRTAGLLWGAAACAMLGLLIAVWARLALGRNWSGEITLKDGHELVTSGPYSLIRHPIYTALSLLLAGIALSIGTTTALVGWLVILASFWIKLQQEEALMLRQFPDSYPAYMARTKRLLPFLV